MAVERVIQRAVVIMKSGGGGTMTQDKAEVQRKCFTCGESGHQKSKWEEEPRTGS